MQKTKEHLIKQINQDLFEVTNVKSADRYYVDLAKETCTCLAFVYKHKCKHVEICKGIIEKE